jgi:hypothetical protein
MQWIHIDENKIATAREMTCERRLATWHYRQRKILAAMMILAAKRNLP